MGDVHYGLPVERARRQRQHRAPLHNRQLSPPFDELTSLFGISKPTPNTKTQTTPKSTSLSTSSIPTSTSSSTSSTPSQTTPASTKTTPSVSQGTFSRPSLPVKTSSVSPTSSPSPSATEAASSNENQTTSSIPPVVIGLVATVAGLALIILIMIVVRKIRIAKRRQKSGAWGPPIIQPPDKPSGPEFGPGGAAGSMSGQGSNTEKPLPVPYQPAPPTLYPAYPAPAVGYATQPGYGNVPVPPNAYGNQGYANNPNIFAQSAYSASDLSGPVPLTRASPPPAAKNVCIVKRTFIPTLPDELSIATGESVCIISEYDDGWALCEKQGPGMERGVVPLECLGELPQSSGNQLQPQGGDNWRQSRRASSLNPGQAGQY